MREQTDRMIADYEQLKVDLTYHAQKSSDLQSNLGINSENRRRAEDEVLRLNKELDELKMKSRDKEAADSREIGSL